MPRLSRFTLLLTLFILPILAIAQTTAPTKDTVLFDFDSGNFDGWTLTGDCWDKTLAIPKTFTDKQGNFLVFDVV